MTDFFKTNTISFPPHKISGSDASTPNSGERRERSEVGVVDLASLEAESSGQNCVEGCASVRVPHQSASTLCLKRCFFQTGNATTELQSTQRISLRASFRNNRYGRNYVMRAPDVSAWTTDQDGLKLKCKQVLLNWTTRWRPCNIMSCTQFGY
jgi:hypothetical protein